MGKSYSINGYLNAVMQRSARTLLVEGPTDQYTIQRLVAECGTGGQGVVDHAGLLDDDTIKGLGNKERVVYAKAAATALCDRFPKLANDFGSLTDREWDGLEFVDGALTTAWFSPIQASPHFVTTGHSIENYHFDADCMLGFLKLRFASSYSPSLEEKVRVRFAAAIALAGALSMCAKDGTVLKKCASLVTTRHIDYVNGVYHLNGALQAPCVGRNITDPATLIDAVNAAVDKHWAEFARESHSRWVVHGHIGADVLWACIGHSALECNVPAAVCEEIARGYQNERRLHWTDWLSRVDQPSRIPLDDARDWLA